MKLWARNNPEEFCAGNVKAKAAKALNYLSDYQIEGVSVPQDTVTVFKAKEFMSYSEAWLASFPPALQNQVVAEYLHSRGLSDLTIKALDIRAYCYSFNGLNYLYACFPYRNIEGVLAGMRGRCLSHHSEYTDAATEARGWKLLKHRPIKPKDYESNEGLVWYREDSLDLSKPVIIVEGQFDAAAVFPIYDNVTCLFTASASPSKLSFFISSAGVIILLDNDKEGSPAHQKIINSRNKMGKYYTVQKTKFLQAYYPKDCKDAGEMSPEELKGFIHGLLVSF